MQMVGILSLAISWCLWDWMIEIIVHLWKIVPDKNDGKKLLRKVACFVSKVYANKARIFPEFFSAIQ